MDPSLEALPPLSSFELGSPPAEREGAQHAMTRILPRALYDSVLATFMTNCTSCEYSITFEYFHCNICDEGCFKLCETCFDRGFNCHDARHVLSNRSLQSGMFFILGERKKRYSGLPRRILENWEGEPPNTSKSSNNTYVPWFRDTPLGESDAIQCTLRTADAMIRQLGLTITLAEAPPDDFDMKFVQVKLPERSRRPYIVHGGQRVVMPGRVRGTALHFVPLFEIEKAEAAAARQSHRSKCLRMAYWRCCQCINCFNNPAIGRDRCIDCSHDLCEYCQPLDKNGNDVQDLDLDEAVTPCMERASSKRMRWCNNCAKDELGLCKRCWDQGEYGSWATSVFRYH